MCDSSVETDKAVLIRYTDEVYDRGHCWVRRLSRSVQPHITLLLKSVLVGGDGVEQGIDGPACGTHHGWLQRRVRQRFKVRAVLVKEPLWSQVATAPASGVEEERKISLHAHTCRMNGPVSVLRHTTMFHTFLQVAGLAMQIRLTQISIS